MSDAPPKPAFSNLSSWPSKPQPTPPTTKKPAKTTSRRPRLSPLSLPPLRQVLPEVFVSGPGNEKVLVAPSPSSAGSSFISPLSASLSSHSAYSTDSNYSRTTAPTTPIDETFSKLLSASSFPHSANGDDGSESGVRLPVLYVDDAASDVDELASLGPFSPFFDSLDVGEGFLESQQSLSASLLVPNLEWTQTPSLDANGHLVIPGSPVPFMRAPPTTPLAGSFPIPDTLESVAASDLDALLNEMFTDGAFTNWNFSNDADGMGTGDGSPYSMLDEPSLGAYGYGSAPSPFGLGLGLDAGFAALDAMSASVTAEWAEASMYKSTASIGAGQGLGVELQQRVEEKSSAGGE